MISNIVIGSQHSSQAFLHKQWSIDIGERKAGEWRLIGRAQFQGKLPDRISGNISITAEKISFELLPGKRGLEWWGENQFLAGVTLQLGIIRRPRIIAKLTGAEYTMYFPKSLDTWKRIRNTSIQVVTHHGEFSLCPFPMESSQSATGTPMPFFDVSGEGDVPTNDRDRWLLLATALVGYAFYYP